MSLHVGPKLFDYISLMLNAMVMVGKLEHNAIAMQDSRGHNVTSASNLWSCTPPPTQMIMLVVHGEGGNL